MSCKTFLLIDPNFSPDPVAALPVTVPGAQRLGLAVIDPNDQPAVDGHCWSVAREQYATTTIDGRTVRLHTHLMGPLPDGADVVDHLNGNRLDNRRLNLRWATYAENRANVPGSETRQRLAA